jgi:hypothetical protein
MQPGALTLATLMVFRDLMYIYLEPNTVGETTTLTVLLSCMVYKRITADDPEQQSIGSLRWWALFRGIIYTVVAFIWVLVASSWMEKCATYEGMGCGAGWMDWLFFSLMIWVYSFLSPPANRNVVRSDILVGVLWILVSRALLHVFELPEIFVTIFLATIVNTPEMRVIAMGASFHQRFMFYHPATESLVFEFIKWLCMSHVTYCCVKQHSGTQRFTSEARVCLVEKRPVGGGIVLFVEFDTITEVSVDEESQWYDCKFGPTQISTTRSVEQGREIHTHRVAYSMLGLFVKAVRAVPDRNSIRKLAEDLLKQAAVTAEKAEAKRKEAAAKAEKKAREDSDRKQLVADKYQDKESKGEREEGRKDLLMKEKLNNSRWDRDFKKSKYQDERNLKRSRNTADEDFRQMKYGDELYHKRLKNAADEYFRRTKHQHDEDYRYEKLDRQYGVDE